MKHPFISALKTSVLLLCLTWTCLADEGSTASQPAPQSLFDGKTLTGWKETDFAGRGEVRIEDGLLILDSGLLTGVTWTNDVPKIDYEINVDAMRVNGNDFFCGLTVPFHDSHFSLIIGGWGGGVTGISSIDGFDASENETTDYLRFVSDKWYHVRLRVTDHQIEAWLDEKKLVDFDTTERVIELRFGEIELSAPLGFASYSTKAALKNITLTKLPPSEKTPKETEQN